MKITVQQIAHVTGAREYNDAAVATSVCIDSRRVVPGSLFVALPGQHCDGHEFLEAAAAAGAVAALVSKPDVTASILWGMSSGGNHRQLW